jgi:hypothetical protein
MIDVLCFLLIQQYRVGPPLIPEEIKAVLLQYCADL